jgi:hypothetical protein
MSNSLIISPNTKKAANFNSNSFINNPPQSENLQNIKYNNNFNNTKNYLNNKN